MSDIRPKQDSGFMIKMADGSFVSEILANGHPEDPVIYLKESPFEAKIWNSAKAALRARDRVRAKAGECDVWNFWYDEEKSEFVLFRNVEAKP